MVGQVSLDLGANTSMFPHVKTYMTLLMTIDGIHLRNERLLLWGNMFLTQHENIEGAIITALHIQSSL